MDNLLEDLLDNPVENVLEIFEDIFEKKIFGQFLDKIWNYGHSARSMRILRLAHAIVSVPPSGLHRVTVGFCMEVVILRYLTTK